MCIRDSLRAHESLLWEQFVVHELSRKVSLKVSFTKGFHSGFLAQLSIYQVTPLFILRDLWGRDLWGTDGWKTFQTVWVYLWLWPCSCCSEFWHSQYSCCSHKSVTSHCCQIGTLLRMTKGFGFTEYLWHMCKKHAGVQCWKLCDHKSLSGSIAKTHHAVNSNDHILNVQYIWFRQVKVTI